MTQPRFRQAPEAIARELDGEVLIVPVLEQVIDLDDVFFLLQDEVAVTVWDLLAQERTLGELVEQVTAAFEVEAPVARRDLEVFLGELVRVGAAEELTCA